MKFGTGSVLDKDYERSYSGNLKQDVRDKCREFSEAVFKTYSTGFAHAKENKADIKQKLQDLTTVFEQSGSSIKEYTEYLEFLIKQKGNWEFMIPYYDVCSKAHITADAFIEPHHDSHTFGLLGTVEDILN